VIYRKIYIPLYTYMYTVISMEKDIVEKYFYKIPNYGDKCENPNCHEIAEYRIKEQYFIYVNFKHYCHAHASIVANKLKELGV